MSSDTTATIQQPEAPATDATQVVDEVIEHVEAQPSAEEVQRAAEAADRKETEVLKKLFAENPAHKPKETELPDLPEDDDEVEDTADSEPKAQAKGDSKTETASPEADTANRLAFARAKWAPDEIESYIEKFGRERYEKKAAEYRKMQADADRAFAAAKGLNPSHFPPPSRGAEAPSTDSAQRTNAGTPATSLLDQAAIDKLLSESFDEEAATKIRDAFKVTREQAEQAAQARQAVVQELVGQRFETARSALGTKYPGITDDNALPQLRDMMGKLDPEGQSLSDQTAFNTLVETAYYAAFGNKIAAEQRAALIADGRKVRAGQPSVGQRASNPTKATGDFEADTLRVLRKYGGETERGTRELAKLRAHYGIKAAP